MPQPPDSPADDASDPVAEDPFATASAILRSLPPIDLQAEIYSIERDHEAWRRAVGVSLTFALGDVVVLNSGGPLMTVDRPAIMGGHADVGVTYFLATGDRQAEVFPRAMLRFPTERELGV